MMLNGKRMQTCADCREKAAARKRASRLKAKNAAPSPGIERKQEEAHVQTRVFSSFERAVSFLQYQNDDSDFAQYVVTRTAGYTTYLSCHMHTKPTINVEGKDNNITGTDHDKCNTDDSDNDPCHENESCNVSGNESNSDDASEDDIDVVGSEGSDEDPLPFYRNSASLLTRKFPSGFLFCVCSDRFTCNLQSFIRSPFTFFRYHTNTYLLNN